jgi:hypothetical protein
LHTVDFSRPCIVHGNAEKCKREFSTIYFRAASAEFLQAAEIIA